MLRPRRHGSSGYAPFRWRRLGCWTFFWIPVFMNVTRWALTSKITLDDPGRDRVVLRSGLCRLASTRPRAIGWIDIERFRFKVPSSRVFGRGHFLTALVLVES